MNNTQRNRAKLSVRLRPWSDSLGLIGLVVAIVLFGRHSWAEEPKPSETPAANAPSENAPPTKSGETVKLTDKQKQVGAKFRELENLLIRMAELTAPTDPRRAALLRQAVAQSKDRDIATQFDLLAELLREDRLSVAVKEQVEVKGDLDQLLELLLSEDRGKRLDSEKARIREYIKRVNKLIKEQKGLQGETAGDGDTKPIAERQEKLADKAGELAKDIEKNEGSPSDSQAKDGKPSDGEKPQDGKDAKQGEGKPEDNSKPGKNDKKPGDDKKDPDNKKDDKKPGDDEGKPGQDPSSKRDKKDSEGKGDSKGKGEPKEGEPKDGKPNSGDALPMPPQEGQPGGEGGEPGKPPQPEDNPAQKRIAQAEQRMKEAKKKLEEAKRKDATEEQEEAIRELEKAVADLEKILRQLREEEISRMLAMLEARFAKMLEMQQKVYEGTKRIDKVPAGDRDRDDEIESGRLSRTEAEIVAEADKALGVLHEEGTSVVFPEAVLGIREDMEQVVVRLAQAKTGQLTQNIEEEIIAALEEMIAALQKAQKDQAAKKSSGQPGGEPSEPPLVDNLAEIKMIRALQMRVNLRTQRYAEMTKTEQAETPDLISALQRLGEREQRIHRVTRDIVVGRNK